MDVPLDGAHGLWISLILIGVFCLGAEATADDIRRTLIAMSVAMTIMLPLLLAQWLGWEGLPQTAPPGGLFLQTNLVGDTCAALAVACCCMRVWRLVPGLLLGLLMTRDRAGVVMLLGGLAAYIVLCVRTWNWRRMALTLAAAGVILSGMVLFTIQKAQTLTTMDSFRIAIWRDAADGLTLKGNGIGSFWTASPKTASRQDHLKERSEYAHSEPLHYAFELGVGVLPLLAALLWLAGGMSEKTAAESAVLVALLAGSVFAFPFHMPVTGFVAALVAGRLAGCRRVFRDIKRMRRGLDGHGPAFDRYAPAAARRITDSDALGHRGVPV